MVGPGVLWQCVTLNLYSDPHVYSPSNRVFKLSVETSSVDSLYYCQGLERKIDKDAGAINISVFHKAIRSLLKFFELKSARVTGQLLTFWESDSAQGLTDRMPFGHSRSLVPLDCLHSPS